MPKIQIDELRAIVKGFQDDQLWLAQAMLLSLLSADLAYQAKMIFRHDMM